MMTRFLVSFAVFGFFAGTAVGQRVDDPQLMVGVGLDHVLAGIDSRPGAPVPYVSVEAASAVVNERVDLRTRLGADLSSYGAWVGAGASIEVDLLETPLYAEFSFMPGLWVDFDHQFRSGLFELGLGHPVQFRTQVSLGWHLSDATGVTGGLSHKSSANFPGSTSNPGIETFQLRYIQAF